jgi:hypothetical protein
MLVKRILAVVILNLQFGGPVSRGVSDQRDEIAMKGRNAIAIEVKFWIPVIPIPSISVEGTTASMENSIFLLGLMDALILTIGAGPTFCCQSRRRNCLR